MKKDEILNASRKEHQNKDLAEMEVLYLAGSHASRVGAFVCCLLSLLSSMLAHTKIYSPWVICFSIFCYTMVSSFYQNETKERFAIDHYVFHSFRFGICWICSPNFRGERMKEQLHLKIT